MIDGVTILNTEFIDTSRILAAVLLYIFAGIAAVLVVVLIILMIKNLDFEPLGIIAVLLCGAFGTGVFLAAQDERIGEQYTQYEVIISDDVSMNDFMSTYEILEQRGEIYMIREIDNNDTSQ